MEKLLRELRGNQIFVAALGLILLLFLYTIRSVIMLLLIAFLVVVALHPVVRRIHTLKIPRALATIVTVVSVFGIVGSLLYLVYDEFAEQVDILNVSISDALNALPFSDTFRVNFSLQSLIDQALSNSSQIFTSVTLTLVSLVVGIITVLVISIYWLSDYANVKAYLVSRLKNKKMAETMYATAESRLGGWVRGQLLISLIIGVLTYIIYSLLGLPAALALAVIAALLEIIPTLGPILAAVPAILIALTVSPQTAVLTFFAAIGIQQLENHLIAPKVFQYTAKLHPIAIIVALVIGGQAAGLPGVFLAIPFVLLLASLRQGYLLSAHK